mmetsp:Transcript_30310/g.59579  ORF Transcript_30310/g.59579 Transcript_30310/m.59579 type:complete len:167 (-) Transcript_30310:334-834(-)
MRLPAFENVHPYIHAAVSLAVSPGRNRRAARRKEGRMRSCIDGVFCLSHDLEVALQQEKEYRSIPLCFPPLSCLRLEEEKRYKKKNGLRKRENIRRENRMERRGDTGVWFSLPFPPEAPPSSLDLCVCVPFSTDLWRDAGPSEKRERARSWGGQLTGWVVGWVCRE